VGYAAGDVVIFFPAQIPIERRIDKKFERGYIKEI